MVETFIDSIIFATSSAAAGAAAGGAGDGDGAAAVGTGDGEGAGDALAVVVVSPAVSAALIPPNRQLVVSSSCPFDVLHARPI